MKLLHSTRRVGLDCWSEPFFSVSSWATEMLGLDLLCVSWDERRSALFCNQDRPPSVAISIQNKLLGRQNPGNVLKRIHRWIIRGSTISMFLHSLLNSFLVLRQKLGLMSMRSCQSWVGRFHFACRVFVKQCCSELRLFCSRRTIVEESLQISSGGIRLPEACVTCVWTGRVEIFTTPTSASRSLPFTFVNFALTTRVVLDKST